MRRGYKTLVGTLVLLASFFTATSANAASVSPTLIEKNPTCTSLGYRYGLKPTPENTPNGIYLLNNGVDSVTVDSNSTGLDSWSATMGIDAVIVKGSDAANVYVYPGESMGDTNLVTPTNSSGGPAGLSHVEFCYDYELKVNKTANATYTRDWTWTVDKAADQTSLLLSMGQSFPVNYGVTYDATSADSNYAANGTITINNPDPTLATSVTSVVDQVSGLVNATSVTCPVTLPYMLGAGQTLTCTYSQSLPDATSRTNTATVTTIGNVGGGSGSASIVFGDPTNVVDECVAVNDTQYSLTPNSLCASSVPFVYNYQKQITATTCGLTNNINTASFTTNDTATTGNDSWTVAVNVQCAVGCTLTQGYWKTHSLAGPAPYDDAWASLSGGLGGGTTFYTSGKTWYQVFWTAPQGNPYYQLAHQFMAAELNKLNGAGSTPAVDAALAWANTWFTGHSPSSTITKMDKQLILQYASLLDSYNNGLVGPGHCSE
jgi:hypothetical protein